MLLIALSIVLVIIDSGHDHLANHQFVIGAIAVLVVFNLLARLGTWRWDIWDARERRGLRRAPTTSPVRTWPYVLGLILTLLVFAATSIVALGSEGSSWWGISRDAWLVATVGTVVAIVLFSLAKDIVDNDIDVDGGGPAAGAAASDAPPIITTNEAAAAGGRLRRRPPIGGRMAVPRRRR